MEQAYRRVLPSTESTNRLLIVLEAPMVAETKYMYDDLETVTNNIIIHAYSVQ